MRRKIGLLALASAVVASVLIAMWTRGPLRRGLFSRSDMDAVVNASALLPARPSMARLSADFPYRPARRSAAGSTAGQNAPDLLKVIGRLQNASDPATPERRHALGVAYLLAGDVKPAIDALEASVKARPEDAALLNDLAAAYQAMAERQGDGRALSMALETVQRAWKLSQTPQVAWTRAVIIEMYHVRAQSIAAWSDYLRLEPRSEWSDAARQRLRELQQPTDAERWPAVRARLLTAGDDAELLRSVDRFRQDVRVWCEDELLPQWGEAVLRGDASAAARLAKVETLGQALRRVGGDCEVADAVEAIRKADTAVVRLLAQGHVAYGASRKADRESRVADSIREMDAAVAALSPERTPFAWRTRAEHAGMIYMSNDFVRTRAELEKIPLDHPEVSQSCKGFIHAMFGIVDLLTGFYKKSADHYERAIAAYHAAGERDHEATGLSRLAEALDEAGDSSRAYSYRLRALQLLERIGDPQHVNDTLYGGARAAILNGQHVVAGFFLDAMVSHDRAVGDSVNLCAALMTRSAYRYRQRVLDAAATDLADAEDVCRSIADPSLRERLLPTLELAKSVFDSETSSAPLSGLDGAIASYQRTSNHLWLRTAYFARARRLEKRGDAAAAERDFRAALEEGDASRAKIDERELRMSFTATADEIEDGFIEFLLRQHREREAFEIADRRRLRELVDSPTARWQTPRAAALPEIQASLPFGATLIEYRVLSRTVVAWVIGPNAFSTVTLPVSIGELEPAIEEPELQANASFLYDALVRRLEPLLADSRTLIVVPDDALERIAYSGLYDRARQRWLLQAYASVVAPSAQLFAQSRARWGERSVRRDQVMVIRAAAGGADAGALPEAAREARSIAGLYRDARVVDGSLVSGTFLLSEMEDASILQFVGHTAMESDPSSRALRLGTAEQSRLQMADIAAAALPKLRLVYLSACDTDQGRILKAEGSITLARSFFAAGVPAVVGTLWPIDDEAARLAARMFHQRLLAGDPPAEALRQAQLTVASRGWKFRDWATLRVIGAGI